jgi:6-phosphogluconolactonase
MSRRPINKGPMNRIEAFADHDAVADAASKALAVALREADRPSLVATGGTTPGPTYDRLAKAPLDWGRVTVTLTDERWVDASSSESNERLIREHLLVGPAAAAHFLPLKGAGASVNEDAAAADQALRRLEFFDAVLLGMGTDGHIGSLFPGSPGLAETLDPRGEAFCVGVAMSGEKPFLPRISLTLRAFLNSGLIVLLITGDEKRAVVERVAAEPAYAPPVAAILRQDETPVRILWAP